MNTADTDALTERIARAWNESTPEQWAEIDRHRGGPGLKALALQDAARILPIIAAEVRKAKAEAWAEAHEIGWNNADEYWRCDGLIPSYWKADTYPNPYRESGDSDEHR